jgi:hypothetical protein
VVVGPGDRREADARAPLEGGDDAGSLGDVTGQLLGRRATAAERGHVRKRFLTGVARTRDVVAGHPHTAAGHRGRPAKRLGPFDDRHRRTGIVGRQGGGKGGRPGSDDDDACLRDWPRGHVDG